MLDSLWQGLLQLDARLAAALVAAVVSIVVTVVTILFTPIGNYLLAKRQLRDKLVTEYKYEQRKKLRDLIGRYHGRVLQAVEEFHYRMLSLYPNEGQGWLDAGDDYRKVGATPEHYYYYRTTVYRFLALFATIRQFEAEAIFVDSRIADKKDFIFVKSLRAMLWAATGVHLFEGLDDYGGEQARDHFFRDDLRRACDLCLVQDKNGYERFVSEDELQAMIGKEPALDPVLEFFNDLRADEDRYRWDRIVALHLILLAFINDFGHQFQWSSGQFIVGVSEKLRNPEVKCNLVDWLSKLGLVTPSRELPQRAYTWLLHRLPQTRLVRERHIRRVNKSLQKVSRSGNHLSGGK